MKSNPFQAGGALQPKDWSVYVKREADKEVRAHLEDMRYVTLIEPRQQGKTSLIIRLMGQMGVSAEAPDRPYHFAMVDLTTCRAITEEKGWYESIGEAIIEQLSFIPATERPHLPIDQITWQKFLGNLAKLAEQKKLKVVIVLDEIGAVPIGPKATGFFATIRAIYTYRMNMSYFNYLTFILAGAHNPRLLIDDPTISPFNIAQEVQLADFTSEQIKQLVAKLSDSTEMQTVLAERIHYWTDGQPYLTQWLCRALVGQPLTKRSVDEAAEQLRFKDSNHLPNVFAAFINDAQLRGYVGRIADGEDHEFTPGELSLHMQLKLAGIIKADSKGKCKVRNRIYERALVQHLEGGKDKHNDKDAKDNNALVPASAPLSQTPPSGQVTPYRQKSTGLKEWVNLIVEHGELSELTVKTIFVTLSLIVAAILYGLLQSSGIMTFVFPEYVKQADIGGAVVGFVITLLLLFNYYNPQPPTITGNVLSSDGSPVKGAEVFVIGVDRKKETDSTGWFEIEVNWKTRPWKVTASYQGQTAQQTVKHANKAPIILKLEDKKSSTVSVSGTTPNSPPS